MDDKRYKQAQKNFSSFVDDSLLKKEKFNQVVYDRLYANSLESLEISISLESPLWKIVTGYYAMFYMASAYVYRKGYKAQHQIVHKVINEALIFLGRGELRATLLKEYEEEKEKALSIADNLLDSLEYERAKRSRFQYEMAESIKEKYARTSEKRAKEFVNAFRKILT